MTVASLSEEISRNLDPPKRNQRSSFCSSDDGHQFRDLLALIRLVAARDRMFDAVRDVILQDLLLDAPQRGPDSGDLSHDVDTVPLLVHHLGQATHLPLDSAQAFPARSLDVFAHALYIPP